MKDVIVLAGDESLLTVIGSELEFIGLSVGTVGERECRLLIVDADNRTALAGAESVKYKKLLYISRSDTPEETKHPSDAILRRPVSVHELRLLAKELLAKTESTESISKIKRELPTDNSDKIIIDKEERTVRVGKEKISLSEKEFSVFSILLAKRGEIVSRDELSQAVGAGDSNEADVYICFLRKKLERDGKRRIITARGVGYKLI